MSVIDRPRNATPMSILITQKKQNEDKRAAKAKLTPQSKMCSLKKWYAKKKLHQPFWVGKGLPTSYPNVWPPRAPFDRCGFRPRGRESEVFEQSFFFKIFFFMSTKDGGGGGNGSANGIHYLLLCLLQQPPTGFSTLRCSFVRSHTTTLADWTGRSHRAATETFENT